MKIDENCNPFSFEIGVNKPANRKTMLNLVSSNQVSSRFQKPLINILQEFQATQTPIVVLHCGNTLKQGTGAKRTKSMETMEIITPYYTNFVIPAKDRWFFKEVCKAAPKLEGHALSQRLWQLDGPVQIWSQYTYIIINMCIYIYTRATKGPRNVTKQNIRNRCFTVWMENRICWHMFVSIFVRCQNVDFCGGSHTKQHVIYYIFLFKLRIVKCFLGDRICKAAGASSTASPIELKQESASWKICTIPVLVAIWAGMEDTHLVNPCHVAGSRDGPFACHNRAWAGPALKSGSGHPAQRLIMFARCSFWTIKLKCQKQIIWKS